MTAPYSDRLEGLRFSVLLVALPLWAILAILGLYLGRLLYFA
jgi:hypothetical protein